MKSKELHLHKARQILLTIAVVVNLNPALGFDCIRMPGVIRERLPDRDDRRTAVFVGQVQRLSSDGSVLVHITEAFANAGLGTDLKLENVGAESFRFVQGETYLIEAYRASPVNPWSTSTCQHTRLLRKAAADLVALRAWKNGQRVPCDVTGLLWGRDGSERRSGIVVRLAGVAKRYQTVTDREGRFAFRNVPTGTYKIAAVQPGWKPQSITISDRMCPNADLFP